MPMLFPIKLLTAAILSSLSSSPPAKAPDPQSVSKPMCDSNGRPLAGNVRTKKAVMETECE
jgi:hypothetical protein